MKTLLEIFQEQKEVYNYTVEADIFSIEFKETRNKGSFMLTMGIYDGTSSIYLSGFHDGEPDFKVGERLLVKGNVLKDSYRNHELTLKPAKNGIKRVPKKEDVITYDDGMGDKKRIPLQMFGFMTSKRGANSISKMFAKAEALGYSHLAVTDLAVVQSFPEAITLGAKHKVKPIFGMTALSVKESVTTYYLEDRPLTDEVVTFDVETTGFSARYDDVIELGATKTKNGEVTGRFQTFVKTDLEISQFIQDLTGITPEMIATLGQDPKKVAEDFEAFVGDAMLAAHNAYFDLHMLEAMYVKAGVHFPKRPLIDTLKISRKINEFKDHRLGGIAKKYDIKIGNAHRADDDAEATAKIYNIMVGMLAEQGITTTAQLETFRPEKDYASDFPKEITIWVKNQKGLKNLYEIVSQSHTKTLSPLGDVAGSKRPIVTWDLLEKYRDGLIIGSGGHEGHLFEYAVNKPEYVLEEEMAKYDVIQIEPADAARHLAVSDRPRVNKVEYLEDAWKNILKVAQKNKKFIVATDNIHYADKEDAIIHNILIYSQLPPKRPHEGRRAKMDYPMGAAHMRTTKEMYDSFPYLTEEEKELYVVTNPKRMVEKIQDVKPLQVDEKGNPILFTPKIDGIDDKFRKIVMENAHKMYGNPLPTLIEERLEKELQSIISHGFAVIYMISRDLVKKSLEDGYLVGSRGSVGSSLAATLSEITEVNPMPPHYRCSSCQWSIFFEGNEEILSGYDLPENFTDLINQTVFTEDSAKFFLDAFATNFKVTPDKMKAAMERHNGYCPKCKNDSLLRDGQNIPFETFLGFNGDKVPDIDLNFSGVYQPVAHNFTKELFGEKYVFRAGTITTIAEKTAYAFVNNYHKNHQALISSAEVNRLAKKVEGAKDSTGQHPGGILVVPNYMEMTDFSPYQYPANNSDNDFMTSHFDFHSIHDNILKLDILGHDAPTLLRYLQEYTDIDPKTIPTADRKVLKLFANAVEALGVEPSDFMAKTGTLGMPEMGTRVVQDVISETSPKGFGDLITLSGLTHGTNVYYNNAQTLIKEKVATIQEVIGCRDDIMRTLIAKGLDKSLSFKIMESVRKGKGLTPEWEEEMTKVGSPEWYIWSCKQIEYMFPRAHAAAYVLDATRTGFYKVYHPVEYYAAIFSSRYADIDGKEFVGTADDTRRRMGEIDGEISDLTKKGEHNAANKKKRTKAALNIALEAKLRGIEWGQLDLYKSHKGRYLFDKEKNMLIPPFCSVAGLGPTVAQKLYEERYNGVFKGLKDLQKRTGVNKTTIEVLRDMGCLEEIEEIQPTLF